MRRIRLAVFDLDGTLVDSQLDLYRAVNHALRLVGLPERALPEVASFVGEGAAKLVERSVAPRGDLFEPALAAWWEHYEEHLLDHTVLYPGLADLLARMPFPMAVHTNKPGAMARKILAGLSVVHRFVEIVGGDEGPRKPDPAGTRAILERQQVMLEDSVMVGDSLIDLALARAVPMPFVAVGWGLCDPRALQEGGANPVCRTAGELAAALGLEPAG